MQNIEIESLLESFYEVTETELKEQVKRSQPLILEDLLVRILRRYNNIWCKMGEDDYALIHFDSKFANKGASCLSKISTAEDLGDMIVSLPFLEIIDIVEFKNVVEYVVELDKSAFKVYLRKIKVQETLKYL